MSFYEPIKMKVSYGRPPARTGKDYGLPEEYADWVLKKLEDGVDGAQSSFIRVTFERLDGIPGDRRAQLVMWAYLFPPKPRPTLPEVGPGGVVRFKSKRGSMRRAIRSRQNWRVFEGGTPVVYYGTEFVDPIATDRELLNDVDADGFTVELDGLE